MFKRSRISWILLLFQMTIAVIVVVAICGALYLREADQVESNMLDREQRRMEIFSGLVNRDINSAVTDLRLLASGDALQTYLVTGHPDDLERAVRRAVFFSRENPDYDQIRYLDERGQEVIRINENGVIVPPGQLQNKADRPYFQQATGLAPDQIYVSAFDLNVEQGKTERPFRPMLRISMPVFDATGQRRGVYVINVLGTNIIQRLEQFAPQYQQRLRMLNAQGYWLKAAKAER